MSAIQGYCPMGCGRTLFVGSGGHITCSHLNCPCPSAVDEILDDRECEHVVTLKAKDFTVRHPLRERLDDALMTCELHSWLAGRAGPPVQLGRYRVAWRGHEPAVWSPLDGAP